MHSVTSHVQHYVKVLTFSRDTSLESLPPLDCRLSTVASTKVSPELHHLLFQLSHVTYWLLVRAFLHAAPSLVGNRRS